MTSQQKYSVLPIKLEPQVMFDKVAHIQILKPNHAEPLHDVDLASQEHITAEYREIQWKYRESSTE